MASSTCAYSARDPSTKLLLPLVLLSNPADIVVVDANFFAFLDWLSCNETDSSTVMSRGPFTGSSNIAPCVGLAAMVEERVQRINRDYMAKTVCTMAVSVGYQAALDGLENPCVETKVLPGVNP